MSSPKEREAVLARYTCEGEVMVGMPANAAAELAGALLASIREERGLINRLAALERENAALRANVSKSILRRLAVQLTANGGGE